MMVASNPFIEPKFFHQTAETGKANISVGSSLKYHQKQLFVSAHDIYSF
jgi:hypothetical protein